jgi:Spy/CpxP family protein refolding chaperone
MASENAHARPGVKPATGGKTVNPFRRTHRAPPRRILLLAPLLALTLAAPLMAVPGGAPKPVPPPAENDDLGETIQVLMIVSMKRALELTREQEMEVIPKIQRILEERERFARQHQDALRRMEVKLMEESVPEQEFRNVVLRLDQIERQYRELELRLRGEIDRSLNPRQQAELRLFVPQFRRQMQSQIDEARRLNPGTSRGSVPPGPAVPAGPDTSEDEEF